MLRVPESLHDVRVTHEYLSSSDVARIGGDFFDVFELDGRHIGHERREGSPVRLALVLEGVGGG